MKHFVRLMILLPGIFFLMLGYSNCGQVKFKSTEDSTQVGNPGEPPAAGLMRMNLVNNFISQICTQQRNQQMSQDYEACLQAVEQDTELAQILYGSQAGTVNFSLMTDPFAMLAVVSEVNAEACNQGISQSTLAVDPNGVNQDYSPETARAVLASIGQCANFFVQNDNGIATNLSPCLQEDVSQDGSAGKPWKISSCACFQNIQEAPADSAKMDSFVLTQDLDCSPAGNGPESSFGFVTIQNFTGSLDGKGFKIRNLRSTGRERASVFAGSIGTLKNIVFDNLFLESTYANSVTALHVGDREATFTQPTMLNKVLVYNSTFNSNRDSGRAFALTEKLYGRILESMVNATISANKVAGLVGENLPINELEKSEVSSSSFVGNLSGREVIAGLVMNNFGSVRSSQVQLQIEGSVPSSNYLIGGIVGYNRDGGTIDSILVSGNVELNNTVTKSMVNPDFTFGTMVGYLETGSSLSNSNSNVSYDITIVRGAGATQTIKHSVKDIVGKDSFGLSADLDYPTNNFTGTARFVPPVPP